MRLYALGEKLKSRVMYSMTRPRMIMTARSFYSKSDLRIYTKKRIALAMFLVLVDTYVSSIVVIQSLPHISRVFAQSDVIVLSRDLSKAPEIPMEGENLDSSHDGTVSAIPNGDSSGGMEGDSSVANSVPSEESIVDCNTAASVYSHRYQVNEDLLARIIDAESGNKHTAASGKSTARGCFQFIIGTWELYGKRHWGEDFYTKNIYSPKDNVELAAWAISQYGTGDWDASKHIWQKK